MEKQYHIQVFTHGEWSTYESYASESMALHAVRQLRMEHPKRQWRVVKTQEFVIYEGAEVQS